jgi:hypothetical protein
VSQGVDYEAHPEQPLPISPEHQSIVKLITDLYSGSASEARMSDYVAHAIYDDPWSYCDTCAKLPGRVWDT